MNSKEIDAFEKVEAQLMGFLDEVQNLTKKSPDDAVNKFKLRHINAVVGSANKLLTPAQRRFPDFEQFNLDDVPTNSDVLLILRQYANCLEEVRSANVFAGYPQGAWYWTVNGSESERRARPPAKLKKS
jgi:hypothetical protein